MKSNEKFFLIVISLEIICFPSWANAEIREDTWTDPDAWARDHLSAGLLHSTTETCCKCSEDVKFESSKYKELKEQQLSTLEDIASLTYFKKFITMLFNRKNFKYDSNQQTYERSIVFTIQSNQLEKLEQLQDPRDLDKILMEILNNVRTPNMCHDGEQHTTKSANGINTLVLNLLYHVKDLANTSEMRFILVVGIIVVIVWIFNTRFKIPWFPLVFSTIFVYGYFHTYLDCNRELEVNQMLEILNMHDESEETSKGSNLLNYFKGIFYRVVEHSSQNRKVMLSSKVSLGFCRPDHVLIMYFNDIFLKYLQVLIEQCTVTLLNLNSALGFPYNLFSGILLVYMIGYVLKLTFKYIISPSAWAHLVDRKHVSQPQHTLKSQDDRISGDNLKLLLNAINVAPERIPITVKLSAVTDVSGIEELKGAIESKTEKKSSQLDELNLKEALAPSTKLDTVNVFINKDDLQPLEKNDDIFVEDLFNDS